ncbi:MAG TPA: ABC transporter permease [Candidatus Angelobacter sp.]|nr:ABC transporter permease [Candidatus Angelobacter sp.]
MKFLAYLRSIASRFFRRSRLEGDMEEELRSHILHRADDLVASGLDRAEALRRARIEFGGHERFKEECHEAIGGSFMETLISDVRYSLRLLRKSPGFMIAAILTLALGIGANAVVFSVMNAFLLRPLNVPQAESLFAVWRASSNSAYESYPDYLDLRERNHSFDDLTAFNVAEVSLDSGANPARAWAFEASGNYFDELRLQPFLGRFFHAADEHGANSAPYIVLSHSYWHTRFQDDRSVVGRIVQVNKHPYTILGVSPPGFHGTLVFFNPDFYVPIVNMEQVEGVNNLNTRKVRGVFMVMGHLKPGISPAQATADLKPIGSYFEKTYPQEDGNMDFSLARPGLYGDYLGGPIKAFLGGLMILAMLILLAACANLGSLFAARASDRAREVALRLALGANRVRILRQLFTEALLIALMGGVVGVLGSIVLLRALSAWRPFPRVPLHVIVAPDSTVYLVALLLTLASGFLFGAVPVRQILRTSPYEVVKSASARIVGRRVTVRELLLVGQIAICAVLVTSSMVAVRGLLRSFHSDFGFEIQNAMLADTDLSMGGYKGDRVPAMQKRMIEALEAVSGVESVGLTDQPPLGVAQNNTMAFTDRATDLRSGKEAADSYMYNVSPEYFRAAGTALLFGRSFTWHDDKNAPAVAVVNQQFARKLFGSVAEAIGGYYKVKDGTRIRVIGIVEDGKYANLAEDLQPAMFLPILQSPATQSWLVVRSSRPPAQLGPAIRNALRGLDAALPFSVSTWEQELDLAFFASRIATGSLGVMGVMGALLAITGIFGMAAYSVSKRLRELGIRMALGAQRREVLGAALERALKLLAFGSIAGLLLGALASRVLAFIVYQASSRDPLVLSGVVLVMALLGLIATWIPAQRALSIDPLRLLREE